jgi:uncharacterized membrane protein (UPF0127 family)
VHVRNLDRGAELGSRIGVADGWWSRSRGLLGRDALGAGEGLLLTPCRSIHMYGMRFPLDVAFLDRQGTVVETYVNLAPGRRTRWHLAARHALELPSGTLAATGTGRGDRLAWTPAAATTDPLPATARSLP